MSIEENIETIVSTFQKGRGLAETSGIDGQILIKLLDKTDKRYRSVAYEGASMGVVLTKGIEDWMSFLKNSEKHVTQVHIGLGWAIAEKQLDLSSTLSEIEPEMRVKVLDGFGYWNGLFQRRATIRSQQVPESITSEFQTGFDQGVGRAIWYITKGEVEKVVNIINHFPEDRRANLWQGIGVASMFVGGCSDEMISELKATASEFKSNLENGIEAAEDSMRIASE